MEGKGGIVVVKDMEGLVYCSSSSRCGKKMDWWDIIVTVVENMKGMEWCSSRNYGRNDKV